MYFKKYREINLDSNSKNDCTCDHVMGSKGRKKGLRKGQMCASLVKGELNAIK